MIVHIVLIWLKAKDREEARRRVLEGARTELAALPTVRKLIAGTTLSDKGPVVDSSFHAALSLHFENQADLNSYLEHPTHLHYVETCIKPHVERLVVYDFEG